LISAIAIEKIIAAIKIQMAPRTLPEKAENRSIRFKYTGASCVDPGVGSGGDSGRVSVGSDSGWSVMAAHEARRWPPSSAWVDPA
jgi:hypothetical protein